MDGLNLLSVAETFELRATKPVTGTSDPVRANETLPEIRIGGASARDNLNRLSSEQEVDDLQAKPVLNLGLNLGDRHLEVEGNVSRYHDTEGDWVSTDGTFWRLQNSKRTWIGTIRAEADSIVKEDHSFGWREQFHKDGKEERKFLTTDKVEVKITHDRKTGIRQYEGPLGQWTSDRWGKTWTSGDKRWEGFCGIDDFGRYWQRSKDDAQSEFPNCSAAHEEVHKLKCKIETDFNVSIGVPEQTRFKDLRMHNIRVPNADELKELSRALGQFGHAYGTAGGVCDFEGLRVEFSRDEKISALGWYSPEQKSITLPHSDPKNRGEFGGLRGTLLHELTHNAQHKNWNLTMPNEICEFFGFSKNGDKWQLSDGTCQWTWQSDDTWQPVDGTYLGKRPWDRTNHGMKDNLPKERTPATDYFNSPLEAHAEAMAMFLHSPESLFRINPKLYLAVKKWDQADINRKFGIEKLPDGELPKMIRGADGNVVPNTLANRSTVSENEKLWSSLKIAASPTLFSSRHSCSCCSV